METTTTANSAKTLKKKTSSEGGSGNNSDNSALSLGNSSFGFNFDAEEAMMNHSAKLPSVVGGQQNAGNNRVLRPAGAAPPKEHDDAANEAVANLQSIASSFTSNQDQTDTVSQTGSNQAAVVSVSKNGKSEDGERPNKRAKKGEDQSKRVERNAREKERSFRISKQINELRNLLSSGGVIVPKGTKSSVLTEAANYIRMLQQHQYRSEIDRHQLVQQMQMIGTGALGPQAASAIRHVSAQNGVWSLGNFGGVPPKSAMSYYQGGAQPNQATSATPDDKPQPMDPNAPLQTKIEDHEYRFIFNSCSVGMAVASMGGAFIDCNNLFCQLSNYSKQELCSMTIFNLTSRQDLQHAFDLISQMISPPVEGRQGNNKGCVLRGTMKNRHDLGLSVALIKGDDNIAKCFCITLIKNPASPFDASRPVPATVDMINQYNGPVTQDKEGGSSNINATPAYTTG